MFVKERQKFIICDEIATALALDQTVATAAEVSNCSVETRGLMTRGQMVSREPSESNAAEVRVVTALDSERLVHFLMAAVTD